MGWTGIKLKKNRLVLKDELLKHIKNPSKNECSKKSTKRRRYSYQDKKKILVEYSPAICCSVVNRKRWMKNRALSSYKNGIILVPFPSVIIFREWPWSPDRIIEKSIHYLKLIIFSQQTYWSILWSLFNYLSQFDLYINHNRPWFSREIWL